VPAFRTNRMKALLVLAGAVAIALITSAVWAVVPDADALPDTFVATRSDNPMVPSTDAFTELVRLELPAGRYQVTGKLGLHNRDPQAPFRVQCALVPSYEDGIPQEPGAVGSDWDFAHLERSGSPGEEDGMALFVSQELSQPGAFVLGCSGYANQFGAFASYVSINAIEVGSITSPETTPLTP
jgi:hypothetical protein